MEDTDIFKRIKFHGDITLKKLCIMIKILILKTNYLNNNLFMIL